MKESSVLWFLGISASWEVLVVAQATTGHEKRITAIFIPNFFDIGLVRSLTVSNT